MKKNEFIDFIITNKKFSIFIAIFIAIVYFLNINHINQQYIFFNQFLNGAGHLVNSNTFSFDSVGGRPYFYPMWGYSALLIPDYLIGSGGAIALFISALVLFFAIISFFLTIERKPNYIILILLLPLIATASVKWPDAFVVSFITLYAYYFKKYIETSHIKFIIFAAIVFGIQLNFRSELMYLPAIQLCILVFVYKRKELIKKVAIFSIALGVCGIAALAPWAVRYYNYNGKLNFSSSNFGIVAMTGLGHLPNNPWHIYLHEESIWQMCREHGFNSPYEIAADDFLKKEFIKIVKENPVLFAKKCLINAGNIAKGGVYTGEYANLIINPDRRNIINEELKKSGGQLSQLISLKNYPLTESIPIVFEKFIQFVFIILFLVGNITYLFKLWKNKKDEKYITLVLITAPVIAYKFALTVLMLYEPRFMNLSAVFLLMAICYKPDSNKTDLIEENKEN